MTIPAQTYARIISSCHSDRYPFAVFTSSRRERSSHRPSVTIIRRHARLLRARYVDLLQKTLLPSFLLAGSRHALFSVPLLCRHLHPPACPSRAFSIFRSLNTSSLECARIHTKQHAYLSLGVCVRIPGETLKCAAEHANTHACSSTGRGQPLPFLLSFPFSSLLPTPSLFSALSLPLREHSGAHVA